LETLRQTEEFLKPRLAAEIYNRQVLEARARNLIESRDRIEHDRWSQEPEINARTAIFEELTAKGHLSHIEFNDHPDVINQRTLQRLLNGWSDHLPEWEKQRRFNEVVEELTIQEVWADIQAGSLPSDTMIVTISNSPKDQGRCTE
jgi:hypothetical protein